MLNTKRAAHPALQRRWQKKNVSLSLRQKNFQKKYEKRLKGFPNREVKETGGGYDENVS